MIAYQYFSFQANTNPTRTIATFRLTRARHVVITSVRKRRVQFVQCLLTELIPHTHMRYIKPILSVILLLQLDGCDLSV